MDWTRKKIRERLEMPDRQIQFYSEANLLPDLNERTGRGKPRRYSRRDVIALLVVDELFNGYGTPLHKLQTILKTWNNVYSEWWDKQQSETKTEGYLVIYADRLGEREGIAVEFLPKWTEMAINWQGYQSAVVLDIGAMVQRVGLK